MTLWVPQLCIPKSESPGPGFGEVGQRRFLIGTRGGRVPLPSTTRTCLRARGGSGTQLLVPSGGPEGPLPASVSGLHPSVAPQRSQEKHQTTAWAPGPLPSFPPEVLTTPPPDPLTPNSAPPCAAQLTHPRAFALAAPSARPPSRAWLKPPPPSSPRRIRPSRPTS